jgi:hypothetical protein
MLLAMNQALCMLTHDLRTRMSRPTLFPRRHAGTPERAGLRTSRFSSLAMGGVWAGGGVFFLHASIVFFLAFFEMATDGNGCCHLMTRSPA